MEWHIYSRQSNDNRLCAQHTEFLPFFLINKTPTCCLFFATFGDKRFIAVRSTLILSARSNILHSHYPFFVFCFFSFFAKTRKCFMHIPWSERKNTKKWHRRRARKKWILVKLQLVIKVKWYVPVLFLLFVPHIFYSHKRRWLIRNAWWYFHTQNELLKWIKLLRYWVSIFFIMRNAQHARNKARASASHM